MARDMKMILDPKLLFKVHVAGELAGFILALPNINEAVAHLPQGRLTPGGIVKFLYHRQRIQWVKVMVAAIRHKFQPLGLGSVLYCEMVRRVKAGGYRGGELSWVAQDNVRMRKAIASMGAEETKQYRLYRFPIGT